MAAFGYYGTVADSGLTITAEDYLRSDSVSGTGTFVEMVFIDEDLEDEEIVEETLPKKIKGLPLLLHNHHIKNINNNLNLSLLLQLSPYRPSHKKIIYKDYKQKRRDQLMRQFKKVVV